MYNKKLIYDRLALFQMEHDASVLGAVIHGSHAYGMASEDSDVDVRFIYKHRDLRHYLNPWGFTDNYKLVDYPTNMDFVGWDLDKAIRLAYSSNPSLIEWINSPKLTWYQPMVDLTEELLANFTPTRLAHHYVSLVENQVKNYLNATPPYDEKPLFIALRAAMCAQALFEDQYSLPPIDFEELRNHIKQGPHDESVDDLLLFNGSAASDRNLIFYIRDIMIKGHSKANELDAKRKPSKEVLQEIFYNEVM